MKRQGFTLIELLVVIAVIAVLMGILMPSLRMAREQARSIYCQSNLKTLVMGYKLYAEDNDSKLGINGVVHNKRSISGPIFSCNRRQSLLFHELKNTAKTRGHRVTKMSPLTLILPKPSPKKCPCFTEMDDFLVKNSTPSYSMYVTIPFHIITTSSCFTDSYDFGARSPHWKNTTKNTTKSALSVQKNHYLFKEQTNEKVKKKDTFGQISFNSTSHRTVL